MQRPVQFEITAATREALEKWINEADADLPTRHGPSQIIGHRCLYDCTIRRHWENPMSSAQSVDVQHKYQKQDLHLRTSREISPPPLKEMKGMKRQTIVGLIAASIAATVASEEVGYLRAFLYSL